jgi:hypothetical protein
MFILTTWLAVEGYAFYINEEQKTIMLHELRRLCAIRVEYYLKLSEFGTEKDLKYSLLYNFAKCITTLEDPAVPGPMTIAANEKLAMTILDQINVDQFIKCYLLFGRSVDTKDK